MTSNPARRGHPVAGAGQAARHDMFWSLRELPIGRRALPTIHAPGRGGVRIISPSDRCRDGPRTTTANVLTRLPRNAARRICGDFERDTRRVIRLVPRGIPSRFLPGVPRGGVALYSRPYAQWSYEC